MTENTDDPNSGALLPMPKAAERLHQFAFPPLILGMGGVLIYFGMAGRLTTPFWIGAGWTHLLALLAFAHFVLALTYGYGLALSGLALLALFWRAPAAGPGLMLIAVAAYGIRLTVFTWRREKLALYGRRKRQTNDLNRKLALPARVGIWIGLSWLYASYGLAFQLAAEARGASALPWIGAALAWIGIAVEVVADRQKSRFKAEHGDRFCNTGLYRYCRHPNYSGEILFQLGIISAAVSGAAGPVDLLAAAVAPGVMIVVMVGQALILGFEQDTRYRDADGYDDYRKRTPVLVPRLFLQ